jgi:diguanylate cyclase (GGDEF)-like protein/PAS domain S-box-containing protein
MSMTDHKTLKKQALVWGTGLFCCLLGLTEAGIWVGGYPAGMQFVTALSFVCAGAGLIALSQLWLLPARCCAVLLCTAGLLTMLEYSYRIDFGIGGLMASGRMGLNTSICFVLSAAALFSMSLSLHYGWRLLLVGPAGLTLMLSASVLLSHLSALTHGAHHPFTQMSLHTAIGFIVLALGMIGSMRLQIKGAGIQAPGAWPVLFVSLGLTLGTWHTVTGYMTQAAQARFDTAVHEMESTIEQRMKDYEQILQGSKGLLVASGHVSRKEWQQYVTSLNLEERNPGIHAVGYAPRIAAAAEDAHVRAAHDEGFAGYRIWPEQPAREEYYPIFYIEPFDWRNRRSFGYDVYSEPVRRAAMERARDTGEPALSSKVSLMQETKGAVQPGFVMYLPVYNGVATNPEERRLNLSGFVYSPFRVEELFNSLKIIHQFNIGFKIFDGEAAVDKMLLYNMDKNPLKQRQYTPEFETSRSLTVAGRKWLLVFSSLPAFDSGINSYQPALILLGGTLVAFLIFGIFYAMATSRSRAITIADEMTVKLRHSETRYRNLVHNSLGLICSHDESGKLIYINPAGAGILGYTEAELLGKNMRELIPEDVKSKFDEYLARVKEKKRDTGVMAVLTREDKCLMWRYDNSYIKDDDGVGYVLGHAQDVTDMHEAQKELKKVNTLMREMATHDALTGLCNRALLHEHLDQAIKTARRHKQALGLLYLDLDGFKQVNDTLGHGAGDELLKNVAQTLTTCCRKSDIVARLGGDEFAVMLSELATPADAAIVAEKICGRIRSDVSTGDARLKVSASIGIACFPTDGDSIETLMQKADAAMYRAKQGGSDTWRFHDSAHPLPERVRA